MPRTGLGRFGGCMPRTAEEKIELFEKVPVPRAVATLAVPMVVSQLVVLAYNMVDTWYVGQTGDPAQVAALAATYPVFMLLNAVSNFFGVGGGSLVSRCLGEHDLDRAGRVATASLWMAGVLSLLMGAALVAASEPLMGLLGVDAAVAPHAHAYLLFACAIGALPTIGNLVLAAIVRAEGDARVASIGMCLGVAINVCLDPVLIFACGMGVAGAALSTAVSDAASLAFLIAHVVRNRGRSLVRMRLRPQRITASDLRSIAVVGLPAALVIVLASVSNAFMVGQLSAAPVAATSGMGVMQKLETLPFQLIMGISDGVIPLVAYNYASGNRERMHRAIRVALGAGIAAALAFLALYEAAAEALVGLFVADAGSVAYGAAFLRLRVLALPPIIAEFMLIAVFQATGQGRSAMVLSFLRKGTVDLPLMVAANAVWPLYGLMLVQPFMECVGAVVATLLWRRQLR